jgi:hypothetical protein
VAGTVLFGGPREKRNAHEGPIVVEINDPVAHVRYVFSLDEPIAHRQELPAERHPHTFARGQPGMIGGATSITTVARGAGEAPIGSTGVIREVEPLPGTPGVDPESRPQMTTENLGTRPIEGIQTEGKRRTRTWAVGAIGNDRPISATFETWTSPELREVILSKADDPRSGEFTHKLIKMNRSDPDPSLFEPPSGYTVKDESGEFTVDWGVTR